MMKHPGYFRDDDMVRRPLWSYVRSNSKVSVAVSDQAAERLPDELSDSWEPEEKLPPAFINEFWD